MTLIDPAYCDEDDLRRLLSPEGVDVNAADGGDVDDAINEATETINLYCAQRYSEDDLDASTLVNRWCTVLACYFLTMNRGNPPPQSLADRYERAMAQLAEVKAGTLNIPGLTEQSDMRPTMSNLRVDRRYPFRQIRVEPNSTDAPTTLQQDTDPLSVVPYE